MEYKVKHGNTYIPLNSSANKSVITAATQSRKLCGDDTVKITLQSAEYINFAIGDTIDVFGTTYTINQLPTVKRNGERDYEYTLVFEGLQYALIDRVFLMPDNTEGNNLMFDLAGMMAVLITNINRGNSGKPYVLGTCPADTEYKNLSLTEKNCLQVLQQLCQEWDTEFTIVEETNQITINIGAAGTVFGVPFTYGRNGGIYNLNREKGATDVITRLFCYGGTQNLTWYRHNRLCLPSKTKNQSYIEDSTAQQTYGIKEAVKNFDEIYPNRIGTVSSVSGCEYNEFIDTSMADTQNGGFDLNAKWTANDYSDWLTCRGLTDSAQNQQIFANDVVGSTRYLINGQTAKIHFNTGALAGYEVEIHSYDHATQKFVLQPLVDENGYDFPSKTNTTFRIAQGDKYIITDINLPESYKTQAETQLASEAAAYFATVCTPQPKYSLEIDSLALQRIVAGLHSDGEREVFKVGDAVHITDSDTGVDADIRIDRFERDLIDTWKYKLTLTDEVTYTSQVKTLIELNAIKRVVQESGIADPNKIRRGWKDAEELYNMVFDTEGQIYGEKIQPLSIDTTMLKVGARSQQLTLQNVTFQPNYLGNPAYFEASAGYLVHLSIDESGPKTWTMSALSASSLSTGGLYLYARCSRSGNTGTWVLSNQAITFDRESGWYNFLIGTLGSVDSNTNTRTFSPTYGFSTINGRYITTGVIKSADGSGVIIDLDNNTITGNIKFLSGGQAVDAEQFINDTVDDEVSGLGVDGTNLLPTLESKWEQGTWNASTGAHSTSTIRIRNSKNGNYIRVTAGTTYTISRHTDVGASKTYHVVLYAYDSSGNFVSGDSKTTWQTTFPFTWTPATATRLEVGIRHSDDSTITPDEAAAAKIKIERGETATAWTLAPEDVQYGIDKIGDLDIGGRNLLQKSDQVLSNPNNTDSKTQFDMMLWSVPSKSYTGYKNMVAVQSIRTAGRFVLTFEALNASQAYWCIKHNGNTRDYYLYFANSEDIAAGDTLTLSFDVVGYKPSVVGGLEVKNFKLEKGNMATDWTPAPEDDEEKFRKNLTASCSTSAATANKVVTCDDWKDNFFKDGTRITIDFAEANSSENPYLMINGTQCFLKYADALSGKNGSTSSGLAPKWAKGQKIAFVYDGEQTWSYSGSTETHKTFKIEDEGAFKATLILQKSIEGTTDIMGGMVLTNTIMLRNAQRQFTAGISGLNDGSNVALWAGGSISNAQNDTANVIIKHSGDAKFGVLRFGAEGLISMPVGNRSRLNIQNFDLPAPNQRNVWSRSSSYAAINWTPTSNVATLNQIVFDYGTNGAQHDGMIVNVGGSGNLTIRRTNTGSSPETYFFEIWLQCGSARVSLFARSGTLNYGDVQTFALSAISTQVIYRSDTTTRSIEVGLDVELGSSSGRCQFETSSGGGVNPTWYDDTSLPSTIIAKNGFMVLRDNLNFFRVVDNGSELTTTIKGNTDIPGVLWAGRVAQGGTPAKAWGNVNVSLSYNTKSTGIYTLNLSGAKSDSSVIAIANVVGSSTNGWTAKIETNSPSTIKVRIYNENRLADSDFNLVIFGTT